MMIVPFDDSGENWRALTPEQFEACRHAREVNRCLKEGYGWAMAHIKGVAEKRSAAAGNLLYKDVRANRDLDEAAANPQLFSTGG